MLENAVLIILFGANSSCEDLAINQIDEWVVLKWKRSDLLEGKSMIPDRDNSCCQKRGR
jgi:hypothetical protein